MDGLKYNESFKPRINTKMYIIPQLYRTHNLWGIFFISFVFISFVWYIFQYIYFQHTGDFYWITRNNSVTRLVKSEYFIFLFVLDSLVFMMLFLCKAQYFVKIGRWLGIMTFPIFLYYLWHIGGMPLYLLNIIILSFCMDRD